MATSKARVERRTTTGTFFGGDRSAGQWHEPEDQEGYQDIKRNWQAYQDEQNRLVNEQYAADQAKRTISGQYQAAGPWGQATPDRTRNVSAQYDAPAAQPQRGLVPVGAKTFKRRKKLRKKLGAKANLARVRVSAINFWVWGTVATFYFFQVVLALLSTVALGMWYASEFIFDMHGLDATENEGIFTTVINGFLQAVRWVINEVTTIAFALFGIDFEPYNLFILGYVIVIGFGLLQLGTVWFIYRANFINSLTGQAAGAKMAAFVFALVGYCIPVLNLFPLIIAWTITVWFYPK